MPDNVKTMELSMSSPLMPIQGTFCIANRGALSERVAQGNLSQFNSLDLALPWFVARRSIQLSYGRVS
jgi:hypothetical protein